jgi:hypothetical protein
MPDYSKTVIYKIKHNEDYDDINIYVGSTTNFKGRKHRHKSNCNNENSKNYNNPIYQYIRDNGGWEQFVMIPIEEYSCNSKKEKEIKERYYIDLLKPKLNKNLPTRTRKEWREDNKQKIKEYREDNKELILEKYKEWCENNKEKIKEYRENNKELISEKYKEWRENNKEKIKERAKEYRENNKEKIKEREKEWYENNKDKISERRKEKVECKCGSIVCKKDIKIHERTQKHKNFMLSLNKTE